jgi:hypothetical protein
MSNLQVGIPPSGTLQLGTRERSACWSEVRAGAMCVWMFYILARAWGWLT